MDPALWELYEDGEPEDELRVAVRLVPGASPPPELTVVADFGEIVTARVQRKLVPAVWYDERVASLKAPRKVWSPGAGSEAPEDSVLEAGSAQPTSAGMYPSALGLEQDGSGVILGFCDWGLDFTHPNFRNEDGSTRVLALWDQRHNRVFSRRDIDRALASADPFAALGYDPRPTDGRDDGTHGTHVVDIAAGNRREPGSTVGLAPGADIVFVHLATDRFDELENLGDSVNLLEGLDFLRKAAQGRPCVASLSAGSIAGSHCGSSTLERAVDQMLESGELILVQSVGNYASAATHTHARVGPNQRHTLDWLIPEGDRTPNEVEIWYSGKDRFRITLTAPTGEEFVVPLDARMRIELGGEHCGNLYHRLAEPNSGQNHGDCFLYPAAPGGCWRITFEGERVVDGRIHAWIERDGPGRFQSRFRRDQATSLYTTNTICNSFLAIAVGAHDATRPARPPTAFSSRGPTADGRQKPEVSAPGYRICAARSTPRGGWRGERRLCEKSGTSMAAPHVAGAVALMLQAAGRKLSIHEVRSILVGTADPGAGPRGRSSTRIGYGYLNVRAAVEASRALGGGRVPELRGAPSLPRASRGAGQDALVSRTSIERARADGWSSEEERAHT